jgi:hypothetical protein
MKKLITTFLFLTTLFFALGTGKAHAALDPAVCNAVTLEPTVNQTAKLGTLTNNLTNNPLIYIDELDRKTLYYKTGDTYEKINLGHNNGNVSADIVLDVASIQQLIGGTIPAEFQIELTTPATSGCSYITKSIGDFTNGRANGAVVPYWDYCQSGFLGNGSNQAYTLNVKMGASTVACPNMRFNPGVKPAEKCTITVDKPGGYTSDDDVTITSINNVQSQCYSDHTGVYKKDFYPLISCTVAMSVNGGNHGCESGNPRNFGIGWLSLSGDDINSGGLNCGVHDLGPYSLGKLLPGSYTIQVAQLHFYGIFTDPGHDRIYCQNQITVVRPGETPVPEATGGATIGNQITDITIAEALDMCQSIDASAQCGTSSCQEKCNACMSQADGKVWTALGCLPTKIQDLVSQLFTIFSGMLAGFIFICIMWNGIKVMLSRGSPDAFKKAQEAITSCIIGLLVLLFSVLFLKVVGVDILKIPGFM